MKNIIFLSIILCSILLINNSCKKANQAPEITVDEPAINQVYNVSLIGTEVHIEGTATDDEGLHSGFLSVIRNADSAVMFSYELPSVHDSKSYDFHEHYEPIDSTIIGNTPMKVYVKFEDHEDLLTTKVIDISVNP